MESKEKSATVILKNKRYQTRTGIPLNKALKLLNISSNSHLAIRNGQLITDDEMLKDGDTIEQIGRAHV